MKKSAIALLLSILVCAPPSSVSAKVLLGIDVLKKDRFQSLQGKRIGLITNHTGTTRDGKSTIDELFKASGVTLVSLFSPEHGIRGKAEHGEKVVSTTDKKTGLLIHSLYGKTQRPTAEMLKGLDALVFDIQDIGTRFYTYSTTLVYALEEAAKRNIEFIVLDRPNPITGAIVEGEALSPEIKHFTAYLQIPVRHGMTVGEIANWYNRTSGLNAKLTVIKMEGWKRGMWFDNTGIAFRPTSPNMRNLRAAALYPGIGAFEATNISVGRGTKEPFEIFGAPWIDEKDLVERLNFYNLFEVQFKAVRFTPKSDLYKNQLCKGVKVFLKKRNDAKLVDLFIYLFLTLREQYPEKFEVRWEEMQRVAGTPNLKKMLDMGHTAETILFLIHEKAAQFEQSRKPYLLYEE